MYRYPYQHPSRPPLPNDQQVPYSHPFSPQEQMLPDAFPNGAEYQYPAHQTPFEYYMKPEQPLHWPAFTPDQEMHANQNSNPHMSEQPYPQQRPNMFTNPFQNENGQLDFNKMMSTVGQFASTVQQISPVIKQVSNLMKGFR